MDSMSPGDDPFAVVPPSPDALRRHYDHRVAQAIAQHHVWEMLWFELVRDYYATIAYVQHYWHEMDAQYAKDSDKHTHH